MASYQGKKPAGFNFNDRYFPVRYWYEILLEICKIMSERHPNDFERTVLGSSFHGNKYKYFSRNKSELMPEQHKKVPGTRIYAGTKLGADKMVERAELVIESFGYNPNDLVIETSD